MSVSTLWINLLSASGGIIAAIVGYLGLRFSQRSSAKAQRITQGIESAKADSMAYDSARQTWDSLIRDLRNQVKDQRVDLAEMRNKFTAQTRETKDFQSRLEDMEQKRGGDRRAIHVLAEYARQLLKVIDAADLTPPSPPEGLDLTG